MNYTYRSSLLLILFLVLAGCSENFPPVSGKVTMNGKPVPSLTVVFTPVGSPSDANPGPYSTGVTNGQGVFVLKTRHGDSGAVPGPHRVGIEYANAGAMSDLKLQLREADEKSKPSIKQQIDSLRASNKSRIKIPPNWIHEFEVSKEGTSDANFELNSK